MSQPTISNNTSCGLIIPVGILLILYIMSGNIVVLVFMVICASIYFIDGSRKRKIKSQQPITDHWISPEPIAARHRPKYLTKPIYDTKKRKEEGISFGMLIPIGILLCIYYITGGSFGILIPLFILTVIFLSGLFNRNKGRTRVRYEIEHGDARTVTEIANQAGIPQERVQQHIVFEKRRGSSDIWFDSATGERTSSPQLVIDTPAGSQRACPYCGFVLKNEDRFCPYCGAPIMAS